MRVTNEKKAKIYALRYDEHLTTDEIAERVGIPHWVVSRVLYKDKKWRAVETKARPWLRKELI